MFDFLSIGPDKLKQVEGELINYYQDIKRLCDESDFGNFEIKDLEKDEDIWSQVNLGYEAMVT